MSAPRSQQPHLSEAPIGKPVGAFSLFLTSHSHLRKFRRRRWKILSGLAPFAGRVLTRLSLALPSLRLLPWNVPGAAIFRRKISCFIIRPETPGDFAVNVAISPV
jgi:hypothetical protein